MAASPASTLPLNPASDTEHVKFWKDKRAAITAANANPLLGVFPCFQKTAQPTRFERWTLLMLYFTTGLFIQHLALLYGPICRQAYTDQCTPDLFEEAETEGGARLLFESAAPLGTFHERQLLEDADSKLLKGAAKGIEVMNEGGKAVEDQLRTSRDAIVEILSGHVPKLNCKLTKCDHWQQVHAPMKDDHGHEKDYLSFLYMPGLCRCNQTFGQKVTYRLAAALCSVIFQTMLFSMFRQVLAKDWESKEGFFRKVHKCFMYFLMAVMFIQVVGIYLIRFTPRAWGISLGISAVSVVTVSFMSTFFSVHIGLSKPISEDESQTYLSVPVEPAA